MNKEYIVIGAGRFGSAVAKELFKMGSQVLVVDKDEDKINDISDKVTHAIVADATDERILKAIDLSNFDIAIIGIGEDVKSAMLVTIMAKEHGVKYVVCKALDEIQAKVLNKIGADKVVFPERDMGIKIAKSLTSDYILNSIDLDTKCSIIEISISKKWIGKTLKELNFRAKYGINVLAIKKNNIFNANPNPEEKLSKDDLLLIAGDSKHIGELLKQ